MKTELQEKLDIARNLRAKNKDAEIGFFYKGKHYNY